MRLLRRTYVRDPERFSAALQVVSGAKKLRRLRQPRSSGAVVSGCEKELLEAAATIARELGLIERFR
ncbi:MAG: hypothetical protein IJH67_04595 [Thermoguttaceae bacterium]|nr:hypothetical protein [Thermoguttaceae bacterium]